MSRPTMNGIGPVLMFATIIRLAMAPIGGGEGAPPRVPGMVLSSGKACIAAGDKAWQTRAAIRELAADGSKAVHRDGS